MIATPFMEKSIFLKGEIDMFNKFEFFGAIALSLVGGIAIGYSKARERCLQAIIKATAQKEETTEKEES